MYKAVCLLLIGLALSCGSRITTLTEPANNDNFIVIGSIIMQNNGFTPETAVYYDGIDVLITGQITSEGKSKVQDHWVVTDKNGYFVLANVPPGEYALKAIRTTVGIQNLITIANSLRYSGAEFQLQANEKIPYGASYFEEKPIGRVVDLKHNFFMVDYSSKSNYRVQYQKVSRVSQAKLVNGEIISRTSVPEYFIAQYPQSQWVPVLQKLVN
jgi:hypothetical protein